MEQLRAAARERMLAGKKQDPVAKLPQGNDTPPAKSRDKAAEERQRAAGTAPGKPAENTSGNNSGSDSRDKAAQMFVLK